MTPGMPHLKTLVACVFLLFHIATGNAQLDDRPPPRYSSHRLPNTRFTCEGKFTGRYYADPETDCQMFHICSKTSKRDFSDFKFLCPNGTVFDQEHQVCADYYQVVCHFDSDTNPLGPIFEIFKLSSKESTNRREFGSVPPRRDPEYLGQNALSIEDFQVEEYNNNKLASSRNALPFQSTQIKPLKDDILFKSTTTPPPPSPIPTKAEVIYTTPQQTTRQPTSTRRNILGNAPILLKSSTLPQPSTTAVPINFSRRIVHFPTSTPSSLQSHFETLYDRIRGNKRTDAPVVTSSSQRPTTTTTYRPTTTTESPRRPASIFDDPQLRFKDFASLNKFQTQFHASFANNPPRTTEPPITSTTERFTTSTFGPIIDYTEFGNFRIEYETTTSPPASGRRFPSGSDLNYNSFFDSSKSIEDERGFTTTQEPFPERGTTANLDFNTRPHSETKPPNYQTTRQIPTYDQTFRTTYQDVTTSGPQTFQQQPSRFSDEFFRKLDKPINFISTDDEDDFFANAVPTDQSGFGRNSAESNSVTEAAATTTTTTSSTVRPHRRRRPEAEIQRRKNIRLAAERLKLSRRGESPRFENLTSTSVTVVEKSVSGEIFNVESSINSGSAGINHFQHQKIAGVTGDVGLSFTTTPSPRPRGFFGRRARPSAEGRAHDEQGDEGIKTFKNQFGRNDHRRERPTSPSTSERPDFVFATTYRPTNRIRLTTTNNFTTTTTTVEPELVTASDEDIARLRSKSQSSSTAGPSEKPTILSLKVTSKSAFKAVSPSAPKPTRKSVSDESNVGGTRSPDYDYSYYDTDNDRGVASIIKQDSFGDKFSNV